MMAKVKHCNIGYPGDHEAVLTETIRAKMIYLDRRTRVDKSGAYLVV